MIDLHVHSTFSDGSLTPAELISEANAIGLKALALTDHDTVDGIGPFLEAGKRKAEENGSELVCVPGVEISANVKTGTMHILGYLFDCANKDLNSMLCKIRGGRESRNEQIMAKLKDNGVELDWAEVEKLSSEDVVGRPHIARAMVAAGYVRNTQEAFDKYLAKGKPAYVDRFRLSPAGSVETIRNAGGVAVLAHPFTLELDAKELRNLVAELSDAGLQGIECYYPEHKDSMVQHYIGLAKEFDLVATGGSDFHGEMNPEIRLGRGFGSLKVPDQVVDALYEAWESLGETAPLVSA